MQVTTSAGDLVPLAERLRVLRLMRLALVLIAIPVSVFLAQAKGAPLSAVVAASVALLLAGTGVELLWRISPDRSGWVFGVTAMLDALYLAWVSYATAGFATPLTYLILLQLMVVSLIASSRTGLKLAAWDLILLICAHYADQAQLLHVLGGAHAHLTGGYTSIVVYGSVFYAVALATSAFAAVNERELRRRRYDLEALAQLALSLEAVDEPRGVADVLLGSVADAFGYERACVVEPSSGSLSVLTTLGLDDGAPRPGAELAPSAAPIVTEAMERGERMLVAGAARRDDQILAACAPERNAIIVPLRADHVHGVLVLEHGMRKGSRVERRVATMLERFCSHAALALANATLLKQIRDQALTDTLTGLANRRHLDDALARACAEARREGRTLSVIMLDIDHFKSLNDKYGHQVGDRVLQLTGRALAQVTRAMDFAARYGGEEFCVVLPGADLETAVTAAERIRTAVAERCSDYRVTVSAGVACEASETVTPEHVVAAADSALYSAKRGGRNRVVTADA